ncbi:hypothetical protein [Melittangium boletus]|uniref:Uncharacterized protein n=1 Tax=Melittangium boletus DSM 14713 TaxID=1294270 RepID=A0A250IKU5_9BACT|nr:hypothetical protein [Melittangium boletus]ATB31863.1 hypothetical protein MEBOL_005332 [Melittangium boletus DSM 14713]
MSFSVNNRSAAATTTTQQTASTADTSKMESVKDLLSGGSFKMGVDGTSDFNAVSDAFKRFSDGNSADGYALMAEGLGKDFKGKMLASVEKKMDAWLKENPNATPAKVAEKAKSLLMNETVMFQTMKNTITQMANDAISRMRDTFEG